MRVVAASGVRTQPRWVAALFLVLALFAAACAPVASTPTAFPSRDGEFIDQTGRDLPHATSYAFIVPDEADPTIPDGWFDRCTPVRYRISTRSLPENGAEEIREAVRRISEASGVQFEELPPVAEVPQEGYGQNPAQRSKFPPVLLAWARRDTTNLFDGQSERIEGYGGPVWVELRDGTKRFVSGFVVVDVAAVDDLDRGFDSALSTGQLWLHELGHVVGLAHTADDTQMMYDKLGKAQGFGAGDEMGFRMLRNMPCRSQAASSVTSGN